MNPRTSDDLNNRSWPEGDLEYLGRCPLCGSAQRTLLYQGLRDRVFFCAPGSWDLHQCGGCNSAYLDPRPSPESMGSAYERYFTHERDGQGPPAGMLKRIRQTVKNGHLNRRWGTSLSPASPLLGRFLPQSMKAFIDEGLMRHLPHPSGGRALLDVGCGDGQFLALALNAGWRVTGFDPDPKAVDHARSRGLDVRLGDFETLSQASGCFDAVTVSHVIEHVYDPRGLVADCYRMLKPGGYFWIETPNIDSHGHSQFKGDWRGLEPPRHLQLLSWNLLRRLLEEAGFTHVAPAAWRPIHRMVYRASKAIHCGEDPASIKLTGFDIIKSLYAESKNRVDPSRREFITLQATK